MNDYKWLIGVDEVGRGPLAGPVAVGVALVPVDFDWGLVEGVGDSKQVKPANREAICRLAHTLKEQGQLNYTVVMIKASVIDKKGIVPAITLAIQKALKKVTAKLLNSDLEKILVKLDGGLKAPKEYQNQETIIKGDVTEPAIGLASIVAKVTRDRYMTKLAQKPEFSPYDFASHKGYGTKKHREAIKECGLSSEHRQSFCRNILCSAD